MLRENGARAWAAHHETVAHDGHRLPSREQRRYRARLGVGAVLQEKDLAASLDSAGRGGDAVDLDQICLERRVHDVGPHAHCKWQRPAGDVVRRAIGDRRVVLRFEQILRVRAIGLTHRHDERAGSVGLAVGRE